MALHNEVAETIIHQEDLVLPESDEVSVAQIYCASEMNLRVAFRDHDANDHSRQAAVGVSRGPWLVPI